MFVCRAGSPAAGAPAAAVGAEVCCVGAWGMQVLATNPPRWNPAPVGWVSTTLLRQPERPAGADHNMEQSGRRKYGCRRHQAINSRDGAQGWFVMQPISVACHRNTNTHTCLLHTYMPTHTPHTYTRTSITSSPHPPTHTPMWSQPLCKPNCLDPYSCPA